MDSRPSRQEAVHQQRAPDAEQHHLDADQRGAQPSHVQTGDGVRRDLGHQRGQAGHGDEQQAGADPEARGEPGQAPTEQQHAAQPRHAGHEDEAAVSEHPEQRAGDRRPDRTRPIRDRRDLEHRVRGRVRSDRQGGERRGADQADADQLRPNAAGEALGQGALLARSRPSHGAPARGLRLFPRRRLRRPLSTTSPIDRSARAHESAWSRLPHPPEGKPIRVSGGFGDRLPAGIGASTAPGAPPLRPALAAPPRAGSPARGPCRSPRGRVP